MADESFKNSQGERSRIRKIIEILGSKFDIELPNDQDPFLTLVRTVLSQNTNKKNTDRAFGSLTSKYSTPSGIVDADLEEIERLIRPGGLYKSKAKRLKKLARIVCEDCGGDLGKILEKPLYEARKKLLEMPGVGPKTADCVLLFAGNRDVLPVDTHVTRTAGRLGFAGVGEDPERVKEKLEPIIPEGERGNMHVLLIELGRRYCKASNPLCEGCPINDLCPQKGID